jgi:hypothetical protein
MTAIFCTSVSNTIGKLSRVHRPCNPACVQSPLRSFCIHSVTCLLLHALCVLCPCYKVIHVSNFVHANLIIYGTRKISKRCEIRRRRGYTIEPSLQIHFASNPALRNSVTCREKLCGASSCCWPLVRLNAQAQQSLWYVLYFWRKVSRNLSITLLTQYIAFAWSTFCHTMTCNPFLSVIWVLLCSFDVHTVFSVLSSL